MKKQVVLANYIGTIRDFGGNSVIDRFKDYSKVNDRTTILSNQR